MQAPGFGAEEWSLKWIIVETSQSTNGNESLHRIPEILTVALPTAPLVASRE